jgi:hypothetical protein
MFPCGGFIYQSRDNEGFPLWRIFQKSRDHKRLSIGGSTKSRDHAEPAGAEHRPSAADQDQQQGQPFFSLQGTNIFSQAKLFIYPFLDFTSL